MINLLLELLREREMISVLVFTRTKRAADQLARFLQRHGIRVSVLHSDRSQGQRLSALTQFKKGRSQVMVATDVAARGVDVEQISHVINFDVPNGAEDYIHRIGRTARREQTGDAYTLMDRREEAQIREIEQALGLSLPRVTHPKFNYKSTGQAGNSGSHRSWGGSHGARRESGNSSSRRSGSGYSQRRRGGQ